jgi:hypothetical protein
LVLEQLEQRPAFVLEQLERRLLEQRPALVLEQLEYRLLEHRLLDCQASC